MATKLRAQHDVHGQAITTVADTVKLKILDTLAIRLDDRSAARGPCLLRMLAKRLAGPSSRIIKRFTLRSNWAFPQLLSFPRYKCALLAVPLLPIRAAHPGPSNIAAGAWPLGRLPIGGRGDGPSAPPPAMFDEALEDAHAAA
jgi:hypothetical protein